MQKDILDTFIKVNKLFPGNSNSLHKLGMEAKKLENAAIDQIIKTMALKNKDIIFVSNKDEARALSILGYLDKYIGKNKTIITTDMESDNVLNILNELAKEDFLIKKIKTNNSVIIDKDLINEIDKNVVLITLSNIDNQKELLSEVKKHSLALVYIDASDKLDTLVNYNDTNFLTFDARIVNGIEGIALLIKDKTIVITPLLHGGKSSTIYRSGTPALPFIVSFSKAIRLWYENKK